MTPLEFKIREVFSQEGIISREKTKSFVLPSGICRFLSNFLDGLILLPLPMPLHIHRTNQTMSFLLPDASIIRFKRFNGFCVGYPASSSATEFCWKDIISDHTSVNATPFVSSKYCLRPPPRPSLYFLPPPSLVFFVLLVKCEIITFHIIKNRIMSTNISIDLALAS